MKGSPSRKKKKDCCDVHISSDEKQIRQNTRLEQHAFWFDPLGVFLFFVFSRFHVFRPGKEARTMKKRHLGSPFFDLGTKNFRRALFRSQEWAQRSRARRPPCIERTFFFFLTGFGLGLARLDFMSVRKGQSQAATS